MAKYYAFSHCLTGEKTFKNKLIGPGKLPGLSRNGPQDTQERNFIRRLTRSIDLQESEVMAEGWASVSFFLAASFFLGIVLVSSVTGRFVNEAKNEPLPAGSSRNFETGQRCTTLNCTLAINANEAVTFRNQIFNKNALAIFMLVTVGETTDPVRYHEDEGRKNISSYQLQVKQKWAWLRNKRGRFLATLPYDFDILSLRTLQRDAYSVKLNITATPLSCYANVSETCLYSLIAKTIVEELTGALGNVCVRAVKVKEGDSFRDGGYRCCELRKNSVFSCDDIIRTNQWVNIALRFLWAASIGFGLFAPLLFKYLPREFKRGPRVRARAVFARNESQNSEAEVSSLDLISISARQVLFALDGGMLDVLRTQTESVFVSRLCRCVFVILLSCLPLLQGFIYAYLKKAEVGISTGKLLGIGDAFVTLIERNGQFALSVAYCFCIVLICIAIAIPRSLSDFARRLSGRKDERTFLGFRKPEEIVCSSDQRGFQLIYENMVFHLNCLLILKFWKFVFLVVTYPLQKLCGMDAFDDEAGSGFHNDSSDDDKNKSQLCSKICKGVLLLLIFPSWAVLITTAFVLYVFPVTYVAFRIWKMLFRIEIESQCCQNIPSFVKITSFPILYILFIVFCICVEGSYFVLGVTLTFNIMLLGSVTGFTIMGLLFYIDVYLPYIVLGAWVLMYTLRGINKYYAQFTRMKSIVFEECENYDNSTKTEASIRETFSGPVSADRRSPSMPSLPRSKSVNFLVTVDDYGVPSIPLDIFLASSHQLMPFKRIILAKLLKVIALGGYLVVIFLFVMSLIEFKAASTVLQGLALLLLGGLPLLALQRSGQISEAEEIRARFYVKGFIKQYSKRAL